MGRNGGAAEWQDESRQHGAPAPSPQPVVPPVRRLAWLALVLIGGWLLSMTLRPGSQPNGVNLTPFQQKWPALACLMSNCRWAKGAATFLFVDVLGNLAVFVPFGAALAVATFPATPESGATRTFRSGWWLRIGAAGFLFSLCIELVQLLVPSRATDVDDVILNTLGSLLGAALVGGMYLIAAKRHLTRNEVHKP
jgi:glycopeptide antibiotics resistance protein